MKNHILNFCLLCFISANISICAQDSGTASENIIDSGAIYEYTAQQLNNTDTIPGYESKKNKLKISGTIYRSDGVTPAKDVILYIEQADENGDLPIAVNPYIEGVIHPIATNCRNCHVRAGWPFKQKGSSAPGSSYQNAECRGLLTALVPEDGTPIFKTGEWRTLSPLEKERGLGLPDGFTDVGISKTQRDILLGKAFCVPTIEKLLSCNPDVKRLRNL